MLLPPSVDDYVGPDHLVRAIGAYVDSLDLAALGFTRATGALTSGQPAYAPADLLKLYFYGYLNRVRSSRRLAAECVRNLEAMWLLCGLRPSYHVIADFRKDNAKALKQVGREFVHLCRDLGLIGGERFGIDGVLMNGWASGKSVKTKAELQAELDACEQAIARYEAALTAGDAAAEAGEAGATVSAEQLEAIRARAERRRTALQQLEDNGETQLSRHDPDARRLRKEGSALVGYNVQCVMDGAHKLIVTHAVTNAGNDLGQLVPMIEQTIEALGLPMAAGAAAPADGDAAASGAAAALAALAAPTMATAADPAHLAGPPQFLADAGYGLPADIATCQNRGYQVFVPLPEYHHPDEGDGRLPASAFTYDEAADVYHCPGGQTLKPQGKPQRKKGVQRQRYASNAKRCVGCALRAQCLPEKTPVRQIYRSEHAAAVARHRQRMQAHPEKMRERAALCEHPFGTMKRWLGWDHFLLRGFEKVRGEMALLVHCYNLRRVLSILGVAGFIAACRQRRAARQATEGTALIAFASARWHAFGRAMGACWRPRRVSPSRGALRPGALCGLRMAA